MDAYNASYNLEPQPTYISSGMTQDPHQATAPSSAQMYGMEAINSPTAASYSTLQQQPQFAASNNYQTYQGGSPPYSPTGNATYTYQPVMYTGYGGLDQNGRPNMQPNMTYTSVQPSYQSQPGSQVYMLPPVVKKSSASKKKKGVCC